MIIDTKELMTLLGITKPTIFKWIKQGMPVIKLGRVMRFDKEEVIAWMKSQKEGA